MSKRCGNAHWILLEGDRNEFNAYAIVNVAESESNAGDVREWDVLNP
jgi:hypothetical protein